MTVYIAFRIATFPGGTVTWPLKAYETEREADEACAEQNQMLKDLSSTRLVHRVAEGYIETGLGFDDFMFGLGVVEVSHKVRKMKTPSLIQVQDVGLVTP